MADIKQYINQKEYDGLAWVPTIRGALSLEIVEDPKYIFGDVDKYIVSIKSYVGLKSQHHIAASALLTFNDSKSGLDYCRTFRYIFCGHIAPDEEEHNVLKGRLCILAEETNKLSSNEVILLRLFQRLTALKKEYDDLAKIHAESMGVLAGKRIDMIDVWIKIKNQMDIIEKDKEHPRVNFCFDTALFRDGLLLLKYDTNSEYKTYIYDDTGDKDDENDYTRHLPLHRVFKEAMNIIKFLFHTNYHHYADHDTLMPTSNLHPLYNAKSGIQRNICSTNIFHHQLDSLLTPITRMKRNSLQEYTINPRGIFLYANSLINVFGNNGLIDHNEEKRSYRFLNAQSQEYDILTEKDQAKREADIKSSSPWTLFYNIIPLLGIVIAGLQLQNQSKEAYKDFGHILLLWATFIAGFILIFLFIRYLIKDLWVPNFYTAKENSNSLIRRYSYRFIHRYVYLFIFQNSSLKREELSYTYRLWVWLNGLSLIKFFVKYSILMIIKYISLLAIIIVFLIWYWPLVQAELEPFWQLLK